VGHIRVCSAVVGKNFWKVVTDFSESISTRIPPALRCIMPFTIGIGEVGSSPNSSSLSYFNLISLLIFLHRALVTSMVFSLGASGSSVLNDTRILRVARAWRCCILTSSAEAGLIRLLVWVGWFFRALAYDVGCSRGEGDEGMLASLFVACSSKLSAITRCSACFVVDASRNFVVVSRAFTVGAMVSITLLAITSASSAAELWIVDSLSRITTARMVTVVSGGSLELLEIWYRTFAKELASRGAVLSVHPFELRYLHAVSGSVTGPPNVFICSINVSQGLGVVSLAMLVLLRWLCDPVVSSPMLLRERAWSWDWDRVLGLILLVRVVLLGIYSMSTRCQAGPPTRP